MRSGCSIILAIIIHPDRAIRKLVANPSDYRILAAVIFAAYVGTSYAEVIYSTANQTIGDAWETANQMQGNYAFYAVQLGNQLADALLLIVVTWYVAKMFGATWNLSTAFVLLASVMVVIMIGGLAIFAFQELYGMSTEQTTGSTSPDFASAAWIANMIFPGILGLIPIIWWSVISVRAIKLATKIGRIRSMIALLLGIIASIPFAIAIGIVTAGITALAGTSTTFIAP